jgi:hypothetical protein
MPVRIWLDRKGGMRYGRIGTNEVPKHHGLSVLLVCQRGLLAKAAAQAREQNQ